MYTSSPTTTSVTPAPTCTTVSLKSCPTLYGNSTGNISRVIPEASIRSPGLMLAACTLIRTSVGEEIDGTGRLTSWNFAGSEYEFIASERMVGGMLVLEAIVPLGKVGSGC